MVKFTSEHKDAIMNFYKELMENRNNKRGVT